MINRLAELLVRARLHIRRALRATYRFVLVDEFQDTTYAQYDFLLSAFGDEGPTVTVVGDDKQRIMTWAGARIDSFQRFQSDFSADRVPLLLNFRSSADLVRVQYVIARALDSSAELAIARAETKISGDVAQVWRFRSEEEEAAYIASWIAEDMNERVTQPRDYSLLVRQRADRFEAELEEPLLARGLRLRNESRRVGRLVLQDLLADQLAGIVIALLRLGAVRRAPEAWAKASAAVQRLQGADPEDHIACHKAEGTLTDFITKLRRRMVTTPPSPSSSRELSQLALEFLDLNAVAQTLLDYSTGEVLEITVEAFLLHIAASAEVASDWAECIKRFEGIDEIPLMTVHKSKGLQYDTVLFVGLEDSMWWSYSPENPEGLATFFVALSRAKQRAIFTYCEERGTRTAIADLYRLLTEAGVPEVTIGGDLL
jgi:superfamily I DNA/RNA helicase